MLYANKYICVCVIFPPVALTSQFFSLHLQRQHVYKYPYKEIEELSSDPGQLTATASA